MQQTLGSSNSKGLRIVVEAPKGRNPSDKQSRSERIRVIVNAEISTVKLTVWWINKAIFVTFWKDGSISAKLLCPRSKNWWRKMLISDRAKLNFLFWPTLTFVRSYGKQLQNPGQVVLLQKMEENRSVMPSYASCSRTAEKQHSNVSICQSVQALDHCSHVSWICIEIDWRSLKGGLWIMIGHPDEGFYAERISFKVKTSNISRH